MMHAAKDSIDLGIICGDIHASLHFYHDLLGLPNVGVTEATTGTMHRLRFGTSDVKLIDPTHRPGAGISARIRCKSEKMRAYCMR